VKLPLACSWDGRKQLHGQVKSLRVGIVSPRSPQKWLSEHSVWHFSDFDEAKWEFLVTCNQWNCYWRVAWTAENSSVPVKSCPELGLPGKIERKNVNKHAILRFSWLWAPKCWVAWSWTLAKQLWTWSTGSERTGKYYSALVNVVYIFVGTVECWLPEKCPVNSWKSNFQGTLVQFTSKQQSK